MKTENEFMKSYARDLMKHDIAMAAAALAVVAEVISFFIKF